MASESRSATVGSEEKISPPGWAPSTSTGDPAERDWSEGCRGPAHRAMSARRRRGRSTAPTSTLGEPARSCSRGPGPTGPGPSHVPDLHGCLVHRARSHADDTHEVPRLRVAAAVVSLDERGESAYCGQIHVMWITVARPDLAWLSGDGRRGRPHDPRPTPALAAPATVLALGPRARRRVLSAPRPARPHRLTDARATSRPPRSYRQHPARRSLPHAHQQTRHQSRPTPDLKIYTGPP
jgi:hypothetical protein